MKNEKLEIRYKIENITSLCHPEFISGSPGTLHKSTKILKQVQHNAEEGLILLTFYCNF